MPFKYSCFISYCHGQYDLVNAFIQQIKEALQCSIESYTDKEVYIDERLGPGYHYNEELAQAICQSTCMIVIFTPKYKSHSYCLREYIAMERLEKKRLELLGDKSNNMGMIIPIIFRGDETDIPPRIRDRIHYYDFRDFALSTLEIKRNPKYEPDIEKIAKIIHRFSKLFKEQGVNPCECDLFKLPSEREIESESWGEKPSNSFPPFPGREV